jgi:stage V sporulation protein B
MGRGILFSLQSRMVFVFGAYALHIVLARRLGPDEYGAFGVCLSIITICYIFLSNGVRQVLSRRASRTPEGAGPILRHGLAAQSLLSLALGACVAGLAHPLAALLRDPDLRLPLIFSGLVVATQGPFFVYIGLFNGLKRFAAETSVHSFYGLLRPAAAVAFVALGWGVTGGVAGLLLASVAAVLLGAWLARGLSSGPDPDLRIGGILREAAPVMIIFGAATALMNLDVLIVKRLVPAGEETGYYAAASAVAKILYWFLAAFANVLIPFISRSFQAVDSKASAGAVGSVLRRSAQLALPAALLAGLYAEPIIVLVYGGEYRPAAAALSILAWGMTALGLVSILTAGFIGLGGEKKLIIPSLSGIAAVTGLGFWLVPRYGIAGGALAMTAASLLVLGAAAILLQRRLPFLSSPLPWLRLAISLGAAAAAGYWMRAWGAHFLLKVGLLLSVYFLGLALTGELRRGDLEVVRNLFARPEARKPAPRSERSPVE